MSIKSRIPKAKQQSKKVVLCHRTNPRNAVYAQRGSVAHTNYEQQLIWQQAGQVEDIDHLTLSCSCQKVSAPDMELCPGSRKTVCYHSLAAIIKAANDKNKAVTFFDSFTDAVNYLRLGGKLVKVVSTQSGAHCWMVTKAKIQFAERVNMLRGPVEEGIN